MIATSILQRTFWIKYGESRGTAFTFEVDDLQYIATAKHVIRGMQKTGQILIFNRDSWQTVDVSVSYLPETKEDIAILAPKQQLSPIYPINVIGRDPGRDLVYGQDMYWCGFPADMPAEYINEINKNDWNGGYPMPPIRKGIFSYVLSREDCEIFYVDGYNTEGFSGSPLVFRCLKEGMQGHLTIAGVVSAYPSILRQVVDSDRKPAGNLYYAQHTGTLIAYSLKKAVEYLQKNPSGTKIPNSA